MIQVTCKYCGIKWVVKSTFEVDKCKHCGDKKYTMKRIQPVDTYADCPPFEYELDEENDDYDKHFYD
jgi:hypothetical protein